MKALLIVTSFLCIPTLFFRAWQHDRRTIPVSGYKLVWHDEFDGNGLDAAKWNHRGLGKRGDAFNTEEAVTTDGKGNLVIKAQAKGDSILTGIIDTDNKFSTTYGYFECRVKLIKTPGIWVGFWLQSPRNITNSHPETDGAEIDIFEYAPHNTNAQVTHTIHWGGYGATHKIFGPARSSLQNSPDGFHTFGLEWTPKGYSIFVDGSKTLSSDSLVSNAPEFIVLSLEADKRIAGPLRIKDLPDAFTIDYVRIYKKK